MIGRGNLFEEKLTLLGCQLFFRTMNLVVSIHYDNALPVLNRDTTACHLE